MTKFLPLILGLVLACPTLAHADNDLTPDVVTQKVLSRYDVDSKILRPYRLLKETSSRKDGRFPFRFEGSPGIQVLLDRDYWALRTWSAKKASDVVGYMLNPKDGQSALNISIGRDVKDHSDATFGKEPGFYGITTGEGMVGGQKITWRRWSDQTHLYSDCLLAMPSRDKSGEPDHRVNVFITANTNERRSALESCLATLELMPSKK